MRIRYTRQTNQGMTLIEAVVVICVIGFLVTLILPMLARSKHCSLRPTCIRNLKELAMGVKIWAGDHNDKYPMEVSTENGGTKELMNTPDAWKVFQIMSNELCAPIYIFCPEDFKHRYATNFDASLRGGISYFIAASATDSDPQLFLAGDDNFLLNLSPVRPGPINPVSNDKLEWDDSRHGEVIKQGWFTKDKKKSHGNVALTDGSVQRFTSSGLTNALHQAQLATNRLIIP